MCCQGKQQEPREAKYSEMHKKAWGVRYFFQAGIADHVLPNSAYGIAREVRVDGEPMKQFILELVCELVIFNSPLERYID
jgi:hypothetical protein